MAWSLSNSACSLYRFRPMAEAISSPEAAILLVMRQGSGPLGYSESPPKRHLNLIGCWKLVRFTTISDAREQSNRNQDFLVPVLDSFRAVEFPDGWTRETQALRTRLWQRSRDFPLAPSAQEIQRKRGLYFSGGKVIQLGEEKILDLLKVLKEKSWLWLQWYMDTSPIFLPYYATCKICTLSVKLLNSLKSAFSFLFCIFFPGGSKKAFLILYGHCCL